MGGRWGGGWRWVQKRVYKWKNERTQVFWSFLIYFKPQRQIEQWELGCPSPQSTQSAMLSLQSSELAPLALSPLSDCFPSPPFGSRRGIHSLAGEVSEGANSEEGTDTLVL
jgi:hypothetical protein